MNELRRSRIMFKRATGFDLGKKQPQLEGCGLAF